MLVFVIMILGAAICYVTVLLIISCLTNVKDIKQKEIEEAVLFSESKKLLQ